jgi:hypothetical protein
MIPESLAEEACTAEEIIRRSFQHHCKIIPRSFKDYSKIISRSFKNHSEIIPESSVGEGFATEEIMSK